MERFWVGRDQTITTRLSISSPKEFLERTSPSQLAEEESILSPGGSSQSGSSIQRYQSVSDIQGRDHPLAEYFSPGLCKSPAHSHWSQLYWSAMLNLALSRWAVWVSKERKKEVGNQWVNNCLCCGCAGLGHADAPLELVNDRFTCNFHLWKDEVALPAVKTIPAP